MSKRKKQTGKNKRGKNLSYNRKSLINKILSIFSEEPGKSLNYRQVSNLLLIKDNETKRLINSCLLELAQKGDLVEMARGAAAIDSLKSGDKVLIAESCSHHADADDIGRVKIPRWLRQYVGHDLDVEVYSGRDYPDNLSEYKLIVHCGSCMHNRREMLSRISKAKRAGVPITNYGIAISKVQGVLERVLTPFPRALAAYKGEARKETENKFNFNFCICDFKNSFCILLFNFSFVFNKLYVFVQMIYSKKRLIG